MMIVQLPTSNPPITGSYSLVEACQQPDRSDGTPARAHRASLERARLPPTRLRHRGRIVAEEVCNLLATRRLEEGVVWCADGAIVGTVNRSDVLQRYAMTPACRSGRRPASAGCCRVLPARRVGGCRLAEILGRAISAERTIRCRTGSRGARVGLMRAAAGVVCSAGAHAAAAAACGIRRRVAGLRVFCNRGAFPLTRTASA